MTLIKKKDDILYWGLLGLILYMPLHFYLCELLISGTGIDNILRDVVIIALAGFAFFTAKQKSKPMWLLVAACCLFLGIIGCVSALGHKTFGILNVLRTYLVPILIFYVCSSVDLSRERFSRINNALAIGLAVIAVYGFLQAFFLGDDVLIALGYDGKDGFLTSPSFYISHFFGQQRSVGTFVSPNICGIILAAALCALLLTDREKPFRQKFILGAMLMIGLLSTYSRSAMVGFAAAVGFYWLITAIWKRINKQTLRRIGLIALASVIFLVLDQLILKGMFVKMLLSTFFRTFNGEDPSANTHLEHLLKPTPDDAGATPGFFLNFGMNGPMAVEYTSATLVESSFLLMKNELGILGSILFFAPYVAVIALTVRNRKAYPYFTPAAVCIAVLVSYVFLPNVQTFEVPFYCFLFMGLYCNPSVKALYRPESV